MIIKALYCTSFFRIFNIYNDNLIYTILHSLIFHPSDMTADMTLSAFIAPRATFSFKLFLVVLAVYLSKTTAETIFVCVS